MSPAINPIDPAVAADSPNVHVFFFPFLAHGHLIPLVDVAILFAERGVRATVVTTPANAPIVRRAADGSGRHLDILLLPFPSDEVGLPAGCENAAAAAALDAGIPKFYQAMPLLRQPFRRLLHDHHPDCLISDAIFTWTSDHAAEIGIPRVVFHPSGAFPVCVSDYIDLKLAGDGDGETFVVPGDLPHRIELTKPELPVLFSYPESLTAFREAERKSYGAMLNTFYELEAPYVDRLKTAAGRRVWCVAPVHLCHRTDAGMAARGGESEFGGGSEGIVVKKWLDSMDSGSVLYICFGSGCVFGGDQLREIAAGVEASGRAFVWVVRGGGGGAETMPEWMPEGFDRRTEGRGLILTGWAPQLLILNHPAVGGFLSHAGWNSVVEAVVAGVPMAVWPLDSSHYLIERMVVDVAGVGVRVLEGTWRAAVVAGKEAVRGEAVRRAVDRLMGGGEEATAVREKAKEYGDAARSAVEVGGSSYANLSRLIEDISQIAEERRKTKN